MIMTNRKSAFPAEEPVISPYSPSDSEAVVLDFSGHHQPSAISVCPDTAGDRLSFCPPSDIVLPRRL